MEICNTTLSACYELNERIAAEVFEALPECAPLVAIFDHEGHRWASDEEAFARLNLDDDLLADLRAKVDDGAEPAAVQVGDIGVAMMQLATEHTKCGYFILATSRCGQDAAPWALDVTEVLVSLVALTARWIEKDRMSWELETKRFGSYHSAVALTN